MPDGRRLVYLASAKKDLLEITAYLSHRSGSREIGRGFADRLRSEVPHHR
jgi:hypothetical protein